MRIWEPRERTFRQRRFPRISGKIRRQLAPGARTRGRTLQCSSMFRIVLECDAAGLPAEIGEQAAIDIAEEFAHRPWHTNVRCTWDKPSLRLEAQND